MISMGIYDEKENACRVSSNSHAIDGWTGVSSQRNCGRGGIGSEDSH